MSNLPQELIEHIIDLHAHDTATLCSNALVSRRWAPRSQQKIFEQVSFNTKPGQTSKGWFSFQNAIFSNPYLGVYVKKLDLSSSNGGSEGDEKNVWFSDPNCRFAEVASRLPNVHSFKIRLFGSSWSPFEPVTHALEPILNRISTLHIQEVAFRGCGELSSLLRLCPSVKHVSLHTISPQRHSIIDLNIYPDAALQLESLTVVQVSCTDTQAFADWVEHKSHELTPGVNIQRLSHVSVDSPPLATRLITQCWRTLTSLELYEPTQVPLEQLLRDVQLRHLTLRLEDRNGHRWVPYLTNYFNNSTDQSSLREIELRTNLCPVIASKVEWHSLDSALAEWLPRLQRLVMRFTKIIREEDAWNDTAPAAIQRVTSVEMSKFLPLVYQTCHSLNLLEFDEYLVVLSQRALGIMQKRTKFGGSRRMHDWNHLAAPNQHTVYA